VNRSIGAGTAVTLHFALTLATGEVVDSTFEKSPATFVMGDGSLLPGFECKLLGLAVGDKREFIVEKTGCLWRGQSG
jgi:FKBP-type peptidyl-prolyl cis-trans isomerase SlpA